MDNRPIGLLDSGVGGLTVLSAVKARLQNESLIYIGDSKRAPYGDLTSSQIKEYTWQMVNFLLSKNVKLIIFACNTSTAVCLDEIKEKLDIPVIGVIAPGVRAALDLEKSSKIGLIATQATISSQSYQNSLSQSKKTSHVFAKACPDFVPLVESGDYQSLKGQTLIWDNLKEFQGKIDTLILGCTHFPFLSKIMTDFLGEEVQLIDPSRETAKELASLLDLLNLSAEEGEATYQFYSTGNDAQLVRFDKLLKEWLGEKFSVISTSLASVSVKEILIATKNKGKLKEFEKFFNLLNYQVKSLLDYPELPDIKEEGNSFLENAKIKAHTLSNLTGKLVLADDSGLCVDLLGGLPGIWSHRFAGENPSDEENRAKLLHELASTQLSPERRTAHYHTTLVVAGPDREDLVVEANWGGSIALFERGELGFGYDSIFLIEGSDKTAAELTTEEKNEISHRGKALRLLEKNFPNWENGGKQ